MIDVFRNGQERKTQAHEFRTDCSMIIQPILTQIPFDDSLGSRERVARQRSTARRALAICAEQCGVPNGPWEQDANRVPLPVNGYYWSISHKPLLAGAVIADAPVGIDIEHIKPRANQGLWDRLADDREWKIAGQRTWAMFFRLWTAKEATLKANSRGIGGFGECRIVEVPDETHVVLDYAGEPWLIEQFYHAEHIAAVTKRDRDIRWHVEPPQVEDK
jgi:4'-phosphopantetheinyl transferase